MDRDNIRTDSIKNTSNFCIYCGTYLQDWMKVVDHFLPYAYMGKLGNNKHNLFVSCRECNSIKSDKVFFTIDEARNYILSIKSANGVPIVKKPREYIKKNYGNTTCKNCRMVFIKRMKEQVMCSRKCRINFNKKYIHHVCKFCNNQFIGPTNVAYCSDNCRMEHRKNMASYYNSIKKAPMAVLRK